MEVLWVALLGDGFDLLGIHGYSVLGDNQAQVGNLFFVELALVCTEMQYNFGELFEYSADMYLMSS